MDGKPNFWFEADHPCYPRGDFRTDRESCNIFLQETFFVTHSCKKELKASWETEKCDFSTYLCLWLNGLCSLHPVPLPRSGLNHQRAWAILFLLCAARRNSSWLLLILFTLHSILFSPVIHLDFSGQTVYHLGNSRVVNLVFFQAFREKVGHGNTGSQAQCCCSTKLFVNAGTNLLGPPRSTLSQLELHFNFTSRQFKTLRSDQ